MKAFGTKVTFTAQSRLIAALHHVYNAVYHTPQSPADLLPIAVFMAFSIEAYLNQLMYENIESWDKHERKPWKEKIELLHKHRGIKADFDNVDALKFASEIFELRNKLAHGKPEPVDGATFSSYQDAEAFILNADMSPDWFKNINSDWLEDWFGKKADSKFQKIMEYLATLHGLSPTNYFQESSGQVFLKEPDFNIKSTI